MDTQSNVPSENSLNSNTESKSLNLSGTSQSTENLKRHQNMKRNGLILLCFSIFSFITTPIYFSPPDGLVFKLFSKLDPSFKNSGLVGASFLITLGLIAFPIFAIILTHLVVRGLDRLKLQPSLSNIIADVYFLIVIIFILLPFLYLRYVMY